LSTPPPKLGKSGTRIALEVIGLAVMVLSGGCTMLFAPMVIHDPGSAGIVLLCGGVPFAVGLAIRQAPEWFDL